MKELQIERKVYDTMYEAIDGTQFRDEEQCKQYEQSARAVIRAKFVKLIVATKTEYDFFHVGSDDNTVHAVKMYSQEDADAVLQLYFLDNPHLFKNNKEDYKKYAEMACDWVNTAYQKQDVLFVGESYEGYIYFINTRANIIEKLQMVDQSKGEK